MQGISLCMYFGDTCTILFVNSLQWNVSLMIGGTKLTSKNIVPLVILLPIALVNSFFFLHPVKDYVRETVENVGDLQSGRGYYLDIVL